MREMDSFNKLFKKYLDGQATAPEMKEMFELLKSVDGNYLSNRILEQMQNDTLHYGEPDREQLDRVYAKITHELNLNTKAKQPLIRTLHRQIARVAAVLIAISSITAMLYLYFNRVPDTSPGGYLASLTSGNNSKKLSLNKGVLFEMNGVSVMQTGSGKIAYTLKQKNAKATGIKQTLSTPAGGNYKVELSDGTIIVLNAGSVIEYPLSFSDTLRKVKLTGEAYFEVAKNRKAPFVVEAGGMEIKVLGTRFNVSSYEEEKGVKTTLLEGSVMLSSPVGKTVLLKPDQQAFGRDGDITLKEVDAEDFAAWTSNRFLFENEPLRNVMHRLSRWYKFEVDYTSLPEKNLYLNISNQENLQDVLEMISVTTNVKFEWQSNRLTVTR